MANEIIIIIEVIVVFSALVVAQRFFGKSGVMAWVCIASISANILTAKNADVFGLTTALGTVLFASNFLATDILSECYGLKDARKAVLMGVFATAAFVAFSQICLFYAPSEFDYANDSMQVLFGLNLRISASSIIMYLVSNLLDVYLFQKLKAATGGKYLWLRNNVATILCNCLENFAFVALAFGGIYGRAEIITIAVSTSIIEAAVALLDTPFLYLSKAIYTKKEEPK